MGGVHGDAHQNPAIAAIRQQADNGVRQLCRAALAALAEFDLWDPERDLDVEVERVHALLDGLTIHLMLEPPLTSRAGATSVVHTHLGDLNSAPKEPPGESPDAPFRTRGRRAAPGSRRTSGRQAASRSGDHRS